MFIPPVILGILLLGCQSSASSPASPTPPSAVPPPPPSSPAPPTSSSPVPSSPNPTLLAPGFEFGTYTLPQPSLYGPGETAYVRVDPRQVTIELRAAALEDGKLHPASVWGAQPARAIAVMNSAMFQDDWVSAVGHLEVRGKVQNPRWASQQNSLLVTDPRTGPASAMLLDLGCGATPETAQKSWRSIVQSIRLLGCQGEVVWKREPRMWSSALIGQDRAGRLLFLHTRAPYSMHDLAEQLRASPLDLVRLHYTEGGPEASLYLHGPGIEERRVGSYETGFVENNDNQQEWDLPNVVVAAVR